MKSRTLFSVELHFLCDPKIHHKELAERAAKFGDSIALEMLRDTGKLVVFAAHSYAPQSIQGTVELKEGRKTA